MDMRNAVPDVRYRGLTISFQQIESEYSIKGFDEEMMAVIVGEAPQRAVEILNQYLERFPKNPMLIHWLVAAQAAAGVDEKLIRQIAIDNYEAHPDYLHAKLTYAFILLNEKNIDLIEELFDESWDLEKIYPGKKKFHFLEVALFYELAVLYFLELEELEVAENHLRSLKAIYPDKENKTLKALERIFEEHKKIAQLGVLLDEGKFADFLRAAGDYYEEFGCPCGELGCACEDEDSDDDDDGCDCPNHAEEEVA
jgi:tetratricopeptide (TPR) repeat protein